MYSIFLHSILGDNIYSRWISVHFHCHMKMTLPLCEKYPHGRRGQLPSRCDLVFVVRPQTVGKQPFDFHSSVLTSAMKRWPFVEAQVHWDHSFQVDLQSVPNTPSGHARSCASGEWEGTWTKKGFPTTDAKSSTQMDVVAEWWPSPPHPLER